jgi:ACS family sodium-dependent inorganic phosphate cotransporter
MCRGISNTAGTLSGVIGVAVMGQILAWNNDGATPAGWFLGFSLAAALCILGSGVFTVYAKGTRLFGDDSDQH